MSTTTLHPLAADYLKRLGTAARRLPRGPRDELLDEVEAHLTEATDAGMSDAEVLTVLDRLGDPEEIVEAQSPSFGLPARRRGIHEWSAIVLLLFGGFIFGFGWIAGLVLLWSSQAWSTRDKWIGTLLVPGGLASVFIVVLLAASSSSGGPCTVIAESTFHCPPIGGSGTGVLGVVIAAFFLLAPFASSVYLARRAR